jgi:L-asparaginase
MIKQARIPDLEIKIDELFLKDSLDMTDDDREKLAQACKKTEAKRIAVIHGTSKMIESAEYLVDKAAEEIKDKIIVFFGALYPYEHRKTEAMFNLGAAIASCQLLRPGIYIVMNGRVFTYDKVKKNVEEAHFVGEDTIGN